MGELISGESEIQVKMNLLPQRTKRNATNHYKTTGENTNIVDINPKS